MQGECMPSVIVSNVAKSTSFYTDLFGMEKLDTGTTKEEEVVVLGYDAYPAIKLRLKQRKDSDPVIELGDGYHGIGLNVGNADEIFAKADAIGAHVVTPLDDFAYGAAMKPDEDEMKQNPIRYGRLADPDGYVVEISEPDILVAMRNPMASESRIKKVVLGVLDLDKSVAFYSQNVGMTELRRRSNINSLPKDASIAAFVSFDTEESPETSCIELLYKYATEKIDVGTGFTALVVNVDGVTGMRDPNGYLLESNS